MKIKYRPTFLKPGQYSMPGGKTMTQFTHSANRSVHHGPIITGLLFFFACMLWACGVMAELESRSADKGVDTGDPISASPSAHSGIAENKAKALSESKDRGKVDSKKPYIKKDGKLEIKIVKPKVPTKPKARPPTSETIETTDPISTGGGEFRESWSLLNQRGLLSLDFTLIYGPDLQFKSPINDRRTQFPPWAIIKSFTSSTIIRIVDFEDVSVTPVQAYINIFLSNDGLVFEDDGAGIYLPVDPVKYQLKKVGDYYYLMDPLSELVYIFRSRPLDFNWDPQFHIRRVGELVYIIDRNTNTLFYSYNDDNLPTHIEDGLGRFLDLSYIADPSLTKRHLSSVSDGYGRTVSFNYQQATCNGQQQDVLVSFTDAMNQTTSFDYYDPANTDCNLIQRINRPLGNSLIDQTWTQNPKGVDAVNSQKDAYNNETTLAFTQDPNNNIITTVTYPDTNQRVFHHERERYPLDATDPAGNTFSMGYNADWQMTSVTDRLGDTTNITYHAQTGKMATYQNVRGNTTAYTYTAQGQTFTNPDTLDTVDFTFYNLTRIDYPDGTNSQFTYDADGNILTRTDRNGKVWTYTYNGRGQVLTATNPTAGVITNTYNADGTPASSTDSDTGTTTYGYDTYKRLNQITRPDTTTVQMAYDLNDRITSITDENGNIYTYTYDANGNLTDVTDPATNATQYAYDLMDRVTRITDRLGMNTDFTYDNMNRLASVTDPNDIQTAYGYDPRGWRNSITLGAYTWQTGYDNEGVPSSSATPLGKTTNYQTDQLGYTTGITNPLSQTTTLARDAMEKITGITDPLLRTTGFGYDGRGLLTSVTTPVIGTAAYQRNDLGLLRRITDSNSNNWNFTYTGMGRLQTSADPLSNTWQYTYDTRGRLSRTTYPDASTLVRTYDNAGNITRKLYTDGTDLQYTYDTLDRLATANGVSFTRDAVGRVTATDNPGTIFGATYDDGGRLKTATYNNSAFTVTYTYNATTGLLSRVTGDLKGTQIDFTYDNDRRLTGITRSNGVNTTYTYDNASRLTRIRDGSIIDIQYTLDAAGQITSANMSVPLDPADFLIAGTDTFTYDAASQVNSAGYAYDNRGRQTASPGNTFTWNGPSRLTGINNATLTYNGLNDLVTRTEGGAAIHYYYNYAIVLKPIVAEKNDTTSQFLRYYVWTPGGRLLYMIDAENGNAVYFHHFDRTGSTLALTNAAGAVTDSYAYTPYGKLLQHNGSSTQPFTFVGQFGVRQEGSNGTLYHMRARYYDATTMSFVLRDQVWPVLPDALSLNPYQYAMQNPLSYVDPKGTAVITTVGIFVGGFILKQVFIGWLLTKEVNVGAEITEEDIRREEIALENKLLRAYEEEQDRRRALNLPSPPRPTFGIDSAIPPTRNEDKVGGLSYQTETVVPRADSKREVSGTGKKKLSTEPASKLFGQLPGNDFRPIFYHMGHIEKGELITDTAIYHSGYD